MAITKKGWEKRKANGFGAAWNKGVKLPNQTGENNPKWKGDDVSYSALHHWVYRKLGKPQKCSHCDNCTKLEWASISHQAKRDLNDYFALCKFCHRKYDKNIKSKQGINFKLNTEYFNRWSGEWVKRASA